MAVPAERLSQEPTTEFLYENDAVAASVEGFYHGTLQTYEVDLYADGADQPPHVAYRSTLSYKAHGDLGAEYTHSKTYVWVNIGEESRRGERLNVPGRVTRAVAKNNESNPDAMSEESVAQAFFVLASILRQSRASRGTVVTQPAIDRSKAGREQTTE